MSNKNLQESEMQPTTWAGSDIAQIPPSLLAGLSNVLPDALIGADGHLRVTSWNTAAEELYGWRADETIGKSLTELLDTQLLESSRDEVQDSILATGRWSGEVTHLRRDGTRFPVWVYVAALRSDQGAPIGFLGMSRDLTERKRMEQELRESEARYRSVISAMSEGVVVHAASGEIVTCNASAERILGLSYDQMNGRASMDPRWDAIHEDGSAFPCQEHPAMITLRTGVDCSDVIMGVHKPDGALTWISINSRAVRLPATGATQAVVATFSDITERKQAQDELRIALLNLQVAEEQAGLASWSFDLTTGKTWWSDQMYRLLGCDPALGPPNIAEVFTLIHPDDREQLAATRAHVARGEEPMCYDCRTNPERGEVRILSPSFRVERDALGQSLKIYGTALDVTMRKRAEEENRHKTEDLLIINSVNEAAIRGDNIQHITEAFTAHAHAAFGCLSTAVHLLSQDGKFLEQQSTTLPKDLAEQIARMGGKPLPKVLILFAADGYFGRLLSNPQGIILNEPAAIQEWIGQFTRTTDLPAPLRELYRESTAQIQQILGIRSTMVVPLMASGKVIGMLDMHSRSVFTGDQLERMRNIATQITAAILHRQTQDAMIASEEKYRGLIESLDSVVATVNEEGRFLYTNRVAASRMGMPLEDMVGKTMQELFPEPFAAQQLEKVRTVMHSNQPLMDEALTMVKGEPRWYRTVLQPIHDQDGRVTSVLVNTTDIHALKEAQQKLQELNLTLEERISERTAQIQDLYDNAPVGYHSLDENGNFVRVNATEAKWLGYAQAELIGRPFNSLMTPASRADFAVVFPRFKASGELKDQEGEMIRKDGSILPIISNSTAVYDEAGQYLFSRSSCIDITERRAAERQIRFQSSLLDMVAQAVITTDLQGIITYWNRAAERIYGWPAVDALGREITEVTVPHTSAAQAAEIMRRLAAGTEWSGEFMAQRRDGSEFWIQITDSPIRDADGHLVGIIGVSMDISERKRAEQALRESEEHNRLLFEESPIAFTLLDSQGCVVRLNRAFHTLTGMSQEQALGHSARELHLVPEDGYDRLRDAVQQRRKAFVTLEHTLNCADGAMLAVESRVFPLDLGGVEHFLAATSDITAHKRAQLVLQLANSELERANRVKDEFLASMSHELRTPLNAIIGLSDSLLEQTAGAMNPRQAKYVAIINESGQHLLTLINDILDIAKVEAGQLTLDWTSTDVLSVCQSSLHMIRELAQKKNLEVNCEIDETVQTIWADGRRLKQMLVNLLSNAVKFTPDRGKIGLTVGPNSGGDRLVFTVWDTGIGIREEDQAALFEPFVQVNQSLTREATGTGLGLAIVAKMVRLHGGDVGLESRFGAGSRFAISLPWNGNPSAASSTATHSIDAMATGEAGGAPPATILVVEDADESILVIHDYLASLGHTVKVARNGIDGIALAQTLNPDLIFMDIQMPGVDGLSAAKILRKQPALAQTPIIALTALAMPGDRERCLAAGMNDYIAKPINLKQMAETIRRHVRVGKKTRQ